jgi:hypothetical protein
MFSLFRSRRRAGGQQGTRAISRPRTSTVLAFVGGAVVALLLLPAGITAATSQPPLNMLITDPDDHSRHAKVNENGALRVSGTSTVNGSVEVTNTPLPVTGTVDVGNLPARLEVTTAPASEFFGRSFDLDAGRGEVFDLPEPIDVATLTFPGGNDDELTVRLSEGDEQRLRIGDNENLPKFVTLTQPIRVTRVLVFCHNEILDCEFELYLAGS